jgi:hypothetical protein
LTKTKDQKKSSAGRPGAPELTFVVDVSSFTKDGFVGTSSYEGKRVDLGFDDAGKGVFLTREMAARLGVAKGSAVSLAIEDDNNLVTETLVAGITEAPRISDAKAYYSIGREGGAVVRIRLA